MIQLPINGPVYPFRLDFQAKPSFLACADPPLPVGPGPLFLVLGELVDIKIAVAEVQLKQVVLRDRLAAAHPGAAARSDRPRPVTPVRFPVGGA
jgi:hypothetical protein